MDTEQIKTKDIVYQDQFVAIVKGIYEDNDGLWSTDHLNGGRPRQVVSKGSVRYWLYNSDLTILYAHSEYHKKYGYKSIAAPKEGMLRAELSEGVWYIFSIFGKLLKPFSFFDVSDFNNGFAHVVLVRNCGECLIDHSGQLFIQNSKGKLLLLPSGFSGGFMIDDHHIALRPENNNVFYLYDEDINPLIIKVYNEDIRIYFEGFEKGPAEWCVRLYNCHCFPNQNVSTKLCLFNLETNTVFYTGRTIYATSREADDVHFMPIGSDCVYYSDVVNEEKKEWDNDDRCEIISRNDYVAVTLYFKNGFSYSDLCNIELLVEQQLILIKGGSFIINDCNRQTLSGCLSFSGETIIPIIYSEVKRVDNLIVARRGYETFKFNYKGQLEWEGAFLPTGVHSYRALDGNRLIVGNYSGKGSDCCQYGILDVSNMCFIVSMEYDQFTKTDDDTYIVSQNGKFGLLDSKFELLIPCKYISLNHFFNQLYFYSVYGNGLERHGVMDRNGKVVIEALFTYISYAGDDRLSFGSFGGYSSDNRTNYTDYCFNTIAKDDTGKEFKMHGFWDLADTFSNNLCRFVNNEGKWGLVNTNSEIITNNWYDSLQKSDIPAVYIGKIGDSFFVMNPQCNIEIRVDCDLCWTDEESGKLGFLFVISDHLEGLIDSGGETILEKEYSSISIQSDHIRLNKDDLVGRADIDGNIIIPCEYKELKQLSNGYYIVQKEYASLLSPYGRAIISSDEPYSRILEVDGRCLMTVTINEKGEHHYGLISLKGKVRRKPDLSSIGKFKNKLAIASIGGKRTLRHNYITGRKELFLEGGRYGVINEDGIFVIKPEYDFIGDEKEGYRVVSKRVDSVKLYGVIDHDGSSIIQEEYSFIRIVNNGLFVIAAGGKWQSDGWDKELLPVLKEDKEKYLVGAKWGIIDAHGKLVVEPFADFMQVISEEKVTFRIGEKYGILDLKSSERILTDYDYLLSFHEGRCISGKFNERKSLLFGYIKDDGSELVPCLYTKAYNFENGEGHLESGPDCDVVDLNGKVISSYSERDSYDPSDNYDWARETWYALTDGQYGDYPGPGTDFDALYDALGY